MTIYGRSEELVSRCVECDLAEPESLSSLGGSAPGVVDGILSGIAKKRIWDLQEATRTSLLFALHEWLCMLSIHPWPYVMRTANEIMISTPTKDCDKSLQELFSGVSVLLIIKHFHTFACPTYILDNTLTRATLSTKMAKTSLIGYLFGAIP